MKKILTILLTILAILPVSAFAGAPTIPNLQVNPANNYCAQHGGILQFHAYQLVWNDDDSGIAGNAWAKDQYYRDIYVYKMPDNSFCGIVQYYGGTHTGANGWVTNAGRSPGNTTNIPAGIHGIMNGGYVATFTGTRNNNHNYNLGLTNYMCDGHFNCPGRFSWADRFFSGVSGFNEIQWGWKYTVTHGAYKCTSTVWYNTYTGNSGDIVCS